MQTGAFIRAIQMLSADVSNLTTNLAMTKGQLEQIQDVARNIDLQTWTHVNPDENQPVDPFVRCPIGQYQTVMRLLDALG